MRKVKFTQDTFDEKLGAILTEFPMLDVSACTSWPCMQCLKGSLSSVGPPPFPFLPHERTLRQKSLQARPGSA